MMTWSSLKASLERPTFWKMRPLPPELHPMPSMAVDYKRVSCPAAGNSMAKAPLCSAGHCGASEQGARHRAAIRM